MADHDPPAVEPAPPAIPGTVRRTVDHDGVALSVLDAGEGFPVVLAHGFPELAYSWRHQFRALAAAGCRVLAADGRGYGRTPGPEALEDYDIEHLIGDQLALLDDIGEERAVFVGHDWGAIVVWNLAWAHPERVAGVVGMSVPFVPRGAMPPTQFMRQVLGDMFFYMLYFQEPGVADADLGADPATTMRRMLGGVSTEGGGGPDPSFFANDGRGFVERMPEPAGLPDWLQPGRARRLRRRVRAHRLHRRRQLVPQPRPQLGAHRAPGRAEGRGAVAVHRRRGRPGAADVAALDDGRLGHRPPGRRDRPRGRALGAAAVARRGQRRPRRVRRFGPRRGELT